MWNTIQSKIQTWEQVALTIPQWHSGNNKIVFTNGCFDILHYGHVHYLAAARALGDKLVIGLNSKASVQRLKGLHRPINDDLTRLHLLASLQCVDAVVVFEEDTPLQLIQHLRPDILVKGGDWEIENIVGASFVQSYNGVARSLPYVAGYSTTNIEQKIRDRT